jgi:hypothetical protein
MKAYVKLLSALLALLAMATVPVMNAQTRLNDKDVQGLLKNLRDDAKAFRGPFSSALNKSAIRRTGQEKDARRLADNFARQTDDLYKHFKDKKRAGDQVQSVIDTTGRLDRIVYSQNLGPAATTAWEKVRTDMHLVAQAWGLSEPYYAGSSVPMGPAAQPGSCVASIGAVQAQKLANRCRQVSTATHPPCSAQNSCDIITSEIRRGCVALGDTAPAFCGEYR